MNKWAIFDIKDNSEVKTYKTEKGAKVAVANMNRASSYHRRYIVGPSVAWREFNAPVERVRAILFEKPEWVDSRPRKIPPGTPFPRPAR